MGPGLTLDPETFPGLNFSAFEETGACLEADATQDEADSSEPVGLFGNPNADIVSGLIVWPEGECVKMEEYGTIAARDGLDAVFVSSPATGPGARRRMFSTSTAPDGHDGDEERLHRTEGGRKLAEVMKASQREFQDAMDMIERFEQEAKEAEATSTSTRSSSGATNRQLLAVAPKTCDYSKKWNPAPPLSSTSKLADMKLNKPSATYTRSKFAPGESYKCQRVRRRIVERVYNQLDYLVAVPMRKIDGAAAVIGTFVNEAQKLTNSAVSLHNGMIAVDVPLKLLGFLPYVGTVLKGLQKTVLAGRKEIVKPFLDKVKEFNKLMVDNKVEARTCNMSFWNQKIANKTVFASNMQNLVLKPTLFLDTLCPTKPTKAICSLLMDAYQPVVDVMDKAVEMMDSSQAALSSLSYAIIKIVNLNRNAIWKTVVNFFKSLFNLLEPFTNFLNKEICASLPLPVIKSADVCATINYPCGIRWCKRTRWPRISYPCGLNTCSSTGCLKVPYPAFEMTRFCFSVADIINGLSGILDLVMNALMAVIKKLIPGLPAIEFNLPGLNLPLDISWPDFKLPNFPELFDSLPKIQGLDWDRLFKDFLKFDYDLSTIKIKEQFPNICDDGRIGDAVDTFEKRWNNHIG